MKKLILCAIAMMALSISCSKSDGDGAEEQLPLSIENLKGVWYFKESIKMDNTRIPYKKIVGCPEKRDFVTFGVDRSVRSSIHYANCVPFSTYGCGNYSFNPNSNIIMNCNFYFEGAATITKTTLRIDYSDPTMREFNGDTPVKGIILTRQ